MQPAIAVVPKSSETIAVELKEDVVVGNTDGEIQFTVDEVEDTTKTMEFDGYNYIHVGINIHSDKEPRWLWIVANKEAYKCTSTIQTDFTDGKYNICHYSFKLNAFDALIGNMVLATCHEDEFEAASDIFDIVKNPQMNVSADVEVVVT